MPVSGDKVVISKRFRGFLPVVVDVETGGFNADTDALLEIAAITLKFNEAGNLCIDQAYFYNVEPFPGANLDPSALAFTHIDPYQPLRAAISEVNAVRSIFRSVRKAVSNARCNKAILVGHNPNFDLAFVQAVCKRNDIGNSPFHPFSTFDTATLAGLAFGQTVLAKALKVAGIDWSESEAHSADYDAGRTALLFCQIVNMWQSAIGVPQMEDTSPANPPDRTGLV